jgi:hypothetical protein
VDAIREVTKVMGDLIVEATGLTSLSLPELITVGGHLWFRVGNNALTSFSLPALTNVGEFLGVSQNDALTSFDLPALTRVGTILMVNRNAALPQCLVDALMEQVEVEIIEGIDTVDNNTDCTCEEVAGVLEATCPEGEGD